MPSLSVPMSNGPVPPATPAGRLAFPPGWVLPRRHEVPIAGAALGRQRPLELIPDEAQEPLPAGFRSEAFAEDLDEAAYA
jgi:hypothetical protein